MPAARVIVYWAETAPPLPDSHAMKSAPMSATACSKGGMLVNIGRGGVWHTTGGITCVGVAAQLLRPCVAERASPACVLDPVMVQKWLWTWAPVRPVDRWQGSA